MDVVARPRRDLDADAVVEGALAEVGAPLPRDDHRAHGVLWRVHAHRAVADEDDGPQVRLDHAVLAHQRDARVGHLRRGDARLEHDELARVVEPLDVLLEAEDGRRAVGPLVRADALERAEAVVQRVREHVDLGLVPVDELAVEPDLLFLLDHGDLSRGVESGLESRSDGN